MFQCAGDGKPTAGHDCAGAPAWSEDAGGWRRAVMHHAVDVGALDCDFTFSPAINFTAGRPASAFCMLRRCCKMPPSGERGRVDDFDRQLTRERHGQRLAF